MLYLLNLVAHIR